MEKAQVNELIKKNVAGDITPGIFYEDIPRFTVFVGAMAGAGSLGRFFGALLAGPLLMLNQQDASQYGRYAFLAAAAIMALAAIPLRSAAKAPVRPAPASA